LAAILMIGVFVLSWSLPAEVTKNVLPKMGVSSVDLQAS